MRIVNHIIKLSTSATLKILRKIKDSGIKNGVINIQSLYYDGRSHRE